MAFTSRITDIIDIPGEPGQTITIRKLSHHQLMMAKDARRDAALRVMKSLEGVTLPEPDAEAKAKGETPEQAYDHATIVRCGVTAWTYDDELNEENLLDQDWFEWAFDRIIAFSERSADEKKDSSNGSQPSSVQGEVVGLPS